MAEQQPAAKGGEETSPQAQQDPASAGAAGSSDAEPLAAATAGAPVEPDADPSAATASTSSAPDGADVVAAATSAPDADSVAAAAPTSGADGADSVATGAVDGADAAVAVNASGDAEGLSGAEGVALDAAADGLAGAVDQGDASSGISQEDQAAIDDLLKQATFEDPSSMAPGEPEGAAGTAVAAPAPPTASFDLPNFNQALQDAAVSSIDLLRDVDLNVKIELGRSQMLVEDVLKLGEGSVVELDKLAGDPVDVFVNDRLVARGEVLVLNDNFCVRINEIVAGVKEEGL